MGDVAILKVEGKPREHVTLTVERLSALLTLAEDIAYRRALLDAEVDREKAFRLRSNHEATFNTRCDLYVAIWKRGGKGL